MTQSRTLPLRVIVVNIATWNVNSLKVRLPQVLEWLATNPIDILCLQETKLIDERFPQAALAAAGYESVFAGQPTYNGVAVLWRNDHGWTPEDVVVGNPHFPDTQRRLIAVTLGSLRVISAYVPNGQAVGSDKYGYKLAWLDALRPWVEAQLHRYPDLVIAGDYNIAPADEDVHDPVAWAGQVLCTDAERLRFQQLLQCGLVDAFRLFDQPARSFSWWDYRQLGFQKNRGLRIDHLLLSAPLRDRLTACQIDRAPRKWPQPSDHAPVVGVLDAPQASSSPRS